MPPKREKSQSKTQVTIRKTDRHLPSSRIRYKLAHPFFDEREEAALRSVLNSGRLIQGPWVEKLESHVRSITTSRHAVAVSSGTAALHVAYQAVDLKPGEAVFVSSFAWPSAANVARMMGAVPILIDARPGSYNIDPDHLIRRIETCRKEGWGKPRLIVPVHQFGLPCEIGEIELIAERFRLEIIEDAACALGAAFEDRSVGTCGKMGIFSFHPRKSVTTGEGGMIVTDDEGLAGRCRALRNHGQQAAFDFIGPGLNYRMSELHAALGAVQMDKLESILETRKMLAEVYLNELREVDGIILPEAPDNHTWQTFMVCVPQESREEIIGGLAERHGVEAGIGSVDAHSLPMYRTLPGWEPLPVAARLQAEGMALPLHAGLARKDIIACAGALAEVMERVKVLQ